MRVYIRVKGLKGSRVQEFNGVQEFKASEVLGA